MNSGIYICVLLLINLSAVLSNTVTPLKIVVLDVDSRNYVRNIRREYPIIGQDKEEVALIHWEEIIITVENTYKANFTIPFQSFDVWLFTSALCEETFFLETILPDNKLSRANCVTPVSGLGASFIPGGSVVDKDDQCVYPLDKAKKITIVASVIKYLKWENLIIIFDSLTELSVTALTKILGGEASLILHNYDAPWNKSASLFDLLHEFYNMTEYKSRNFLLMCSPSCIGSFLTEANDFDERNRRSTALGVFSKWLIVSLGNQPILEDGYKLSLDNVATVNFPRSDRDTLTDFQTIFVNGIQKYVNDLVEFNTEHQKNNSDIPQALKYGLTRLSDCWRAEIYTLLYKREGRVLSRVGHVNYTHHVNLYPDVIIFPNTKFGFNQRVFRTTTLFWLPFTNRLPEINGTIQYEGYSYDLLKVLQASLNFSVTLMEPEDGEWGRIVNKTWTGAVAQLQKGEADLFCGPLAISSDREEVMDFSYPYFQAYSVVVFRKPDPNKYKWRKLIEPFDWEVHACIFASLTFVTVFHFIIESLNPFYAQLNEERPTFQNIILYMFGALLTQGGPSLSSSTSGRSLVACWWIFSLITVASYSGILIASLTISKEGLPFKTLDELGRQDEYKWGTLGGSVWVSLLQDSNLSVYQRLWEGIKKFNKTDPDILQLNQSLHHQKVVHENYGMIADKTTAEAWVFKSCDLTYLKELFFPVNYAFGLQNKSPYLQYFSDETMKIMESGLGEILKRDWWPEIGICDIPTAKATTIELIDIQSSFYVVFIGIVIATITMLFECCWKRRNVSFRFPFVCNGSNQV